MANNQQQKVNWDEFYNSPATLKQQIILTAISSLDFSKYKTEEDLVKAVLKRTNTIKKIVNPNSVVSRKESAIRIPATIKTISLERTSKRLVVKFVPDSRDGEEQEEEIIRTDRTVDWDGNAIPSVVNMWKGLEGKHVYIYKTTEDTGDPKKPKVRIAPYVEVIK